MPKRLSSCFSDWCVSGFPAELPCFGKAVQLIVTVRRLFCTKPECPRRILSERLLGFARPYRRATDRLLEAHGTIGSAHGGESGSRLTVRLAIATSPDTLLRRVKQLEGQSCAPPRFVIIDNWASRKGQRYGTIVVDLERGDVTAASGGDNRVGPPQHQPHPFGHRRGKACHDLNPTVTSRAGFPPRSGVGW